MARPGFNTKRCTTCGTRLTTSETTIRKTRLITSKTIIRKTHAPIRQRRVAPALLERWLTGRSPPTDTDPNLIPLSTPSSSSGFDSMEEQPGSEVSYIRTETPLDLGIRATVKNYIQSPPFAASRAQTPCPTLPHGPPLEQRLVSRTHQASGTITPWVSDTESESNGILSTQEITDSGSVSHQSMTQPQMEDFVMVDSSKTSSLQLYCPETQLQASLQSQISPVLLPSLSLETKGRPKKCFDGSRDPSVTPSVPAFIPPEGEGKGDRISDGEYFDPAPFATSLKVMGCRSVSTCDFVRLRLYGALKGGELPI